MITPDKPHSPLTLIEIAAIVAIVVIWGVNNAAAKVATEVLPPLFTGALRFALAAACLVWFVRPPFPNWKSLAIIVVLGGPIHYGLIYLAFWLAQLAAAAASLALPLPPHYDRLYRLWFALGFPAFAAVVGIYAMMVFKPAL